MNQKKHPAGVARHNIFASPIGPRIHLEAPNDGGTADPAPPAPQPAAPTPDPIAQLTAALDAIRADLTALKEAKPAPVQVPTTDQGKPTITPVIPDLSSLPPVARMAAGYRK